MSKKTDKIDVPAVCLGRVKEAISKAKEDRLIEKRAHRKAVIRWVAAFCICFIILIPNLSAEAAQALSSLPVVGDFFRVITFREYHYSDERYSADVRIPEVESDSEAARSVNRKIKAIAQEWVDEFEEAHEGEWGRSQIVVDYEVISTTSEYFTLKLITYQASGSGYEQDHYFTIRIDDGKELMLADLFSEDVDYITPISENIKEQMRQETARDSDKRYWIDIDDEDPIKEWEFVKISEDQSFYIDGEGRLVIAFNEGEVAPMYMGCVEFIIPKDVTEGIGE